MALHDLSCRCHGLQITKIVQGWPKLWANFRALIGVLSKSVGPASQFGPNPVQFFVAELWRNQARCAAAQDEGRAVRAELHVQSEKDAKLAQKLGQLQLFVAVFPQECMGQIASFGPT